MESFSKWYKELSMKKRAFGPVSDVSPNNMINIIKNYSGLDAQDDSYYLLEMIKNAKQTTSNKMRDFLEYAFKAIDNYTKKVN